jgi:stage V sporulation protein B
MSGDVGISSYHTARGTLYLIIKALVVGASNAFFFIFIARFLPTLSDIGLFQGLYSLITISVTLGGAGLSRAAVRFISVNLGAGRAKTAQAIYSSIYRLGLISAAALSVTLYLLSYDIASVFFHNTNYTYLIQLASIDSFFLTVIIFSTSLLYSMQEFKKAVVISILNSLLKLSASFLLVLFQMGIDGIMVGFIVGDVISMAIFFYVLLPRIRKKSASLGDLRPLFSYSLPLYGYSVIVYLSTEIDIYLLLLLSNLSIVGVYSPAVFLGTMLFLGQTALDQSLGPLFSRLYGKSGIKSLEEISIPASRYIFLLYLPIGFSTLASAPTILTTILGERFSESIYPTTIIIIAIIVTSLTPLFNNILMSAGYSRVFLKSSTLALSAQLVISFVTIPSAGGLGASIARAASYLVLFLFPAYELGRITGHLRFDKTALVRALLGSAIVALIIWVLNTYFSSPYYLPFNLFVGFLGYLLFLRFTKTINIRDIEVINEVLRGKARPLMNIITKVVIQ